MKLRVAVCDDEAILREQTKMKILEMYSDFTVDLYASGDLLLKAENSYDMIFLDIEMPEMSGMVLARKLMDRRKSVRVIFLTSHAEFMQEAFKVKAFRYLQKPIEAGVLREAIAEAERDILEDKKLIVTEYGTERLICLSEILYVQADKNRTILYTLDGEVATNSRLKYWAEALKDVYFIQVHKTYLVSMRYIRSVDDACVCLTERHIVLPVARRKAAIVRAAFFEYVKRNAGYL